MLAGLLILQIALSVVGGKRPTVDHLSYLHDPYAPQDHNNHFPGHFCDLGSDEYGRPYMGPFDQYLTLNSAAFPSLPIPKAIYNFQQSAGMTQKNSICVHQLRKPDLGVCGDLLKTKDGTTEICSGSGTQYGSHECRCTCSNGILENCCRVRKEWRSLAQHERCEYIDAVIKASTNEPYKTCYDELINMHEYYFSKGGIHGSGENDWKPTFFLPWHRWYILQLENLLRNIKPKVTVPYWDWSLEADNWNNSIIWYSECGFGGDGDPKKNHNVTTGPFRADKWVPPNCKPIRRFFNGIVPNAAAVGTVHKKNTQQFEAWHKEIEVILHNAVHCNIGGGPPISGTMCMDISANDPIFFLHHGFIDKLWADWQAKGSDYLNLPFYAQNGNVMPGGAKPKDIYNLLNQPNGVKVCLQGSLRPMVTSGSYAPTCSQDMLSKEYSPLKLARLINRPLPEPSDEVFKLFHTSPRDALIAKAKIALLNNYDELVKVLKENDYSDNAPVIYQPHGGSVDLENHIFRFLAFNHTACPANAPHVPYN